MQPSLLGSGKLEPQPIQFEDADMIEKPAEINVIQEEKEDDESHVEGSSGATEVQKEVEMETDTGGSESVNRDTE